MSQATSLMEVVTQVRLLRKLCLLVVELFVYQDALYMHFGNIQSRLNISESVILTNSNNDTDLVGTDFFQRYFNPL